MKKEKRTDMLQGVLDEEWEAWKRFSGAVELILCGA
jgi:hypothetical protein